MTLLILTHTRFRWLEISLCAKCDKRVKVSTPLKHYVSEGRRARGDGRGETGEGLSSVAEQLVINITIRSGL